MATDSSRATPRSGVVVPPNDHYSNGLFCLHAPRALKTLYPPTQRGDIRIATLPSPFSINGFTPLTRNGYSKFVASCSVGHSFVLRGLRDLAPAASILKQVRGKRCTRHALQPKQLIPHPCRAHALTTTPWTPLPGCSPRQT